VLIEVGRDLYIADRILGEIKRGKVFVIRKANLVLSCEIPDCGSFIFC